MYIITHPPPPPLLILGVGEGGDMAEGRSDCPIASSRSQHIQAFYWPCVALNIPQKGGGGDYKIISVTQSGVNCLSLLFFIKVANFCNVMQVALIKYRREKNEIRYDGNVRTEFFTSQ